MSKLKYFTPFELCMWAVFCSVTIVSCLLSGDFDLLYCFTTLLGITALIFVAKGNVFGQILTAIFGLLYGIISYHSAYYGEMITYVCMTAPMAILATIQWLKNPFEKGKNEVAIAPLTRASITTMCLLTVVVTIVFYFILEYFNTANLLVSTVSISTTFIAVYLTYCRNQWYAMAYAINDLVLVVLWTMAAVEDHSYFTLVLCFALFFISDVYAFYNWNRMLRAQQRAHDPAYR